MVENNDLTGFISNDIPVLGNDEKRQCGDLPLVYVDNLKKNTIGKKIPFDLSPQYLWNLFLNQNGKCSLSGMPLEFNSFDLEGDFSSVFLDMIDRSLGYKFKYYAR
jgi:hypothetical protein